MSQLVKFSCWVQSLDGAKTAAGLMGEALEPQPAAVTHFEAKPSGYEVEAYFQAGDEPTLDVLTELLRIVPSAGDFQLGAVPDENWVAISQAALPPVEAGRFIVHGAHDRGRIGRRLNALEIEAGEAFGTAHHATTHGCLEALDRLVRHRQFERVLDLGCGSGVLAIAAAKLLPRAKIMGSDYDAIATDVARENARKNGVKVPFVTSMGFAHPELRRAALFDLVLANILAKPLIELAPAVRRAVVPGGVIVLSGLLVHQAPQVIAAYRAQGAHVVRHTQQAGWSAITLRRGRANVKLAKTE